MSLDVATLQLIILATPGIVWAMLDASHRHSSENQQFVYTLRVLVFGLISLSVVGLIYHCMGRQFDALDFSQSAKFASKLDEILWSIPVAVALALLWIANRTHGWLVSLLRWARVSNYSGTEDIWIYAMNKPGGAGEYVYVRDYEQRLAYFGYVRAYSDRLDVRELFLEDVEVRDFEGDLCYTLKSLYLSQDANSARVEFPQVEEQ